MFASHVLLAMLAVLWWSLVFSSPLPEATTLAPSSSTLVPEAPITTQPETSSALPTEISNETTTTTTVTPQNATADNPLILENLSTNNSSKGLKEFFDGKAVLMWGMMIIDKALNETSSAEPVVSSTESVMVTTTEASPSSTEKIPTTTPPT